MKRFTRRSFVKGLGLGAAALAAPKLADVLAETAGAGGEKPNFVIIFTDDQGYQDLGCFGATNLRTPNIDRMAREGMKFTDFYAAAPICSASRAALMTGCYPQRVSMPGALFPDSTADASMGKQGLHPDEITIAEVLKPQSYATACIGKWHLGHKPPFLPTKQGFDAYFGIPYSNDTARGVASWTSQFPDLPLMENEKTIETSPNNGLLTRRHTEKSVEFIRKNKDKPFFLYLAQSMPHWPLGASDKFRGKSKAGLYGDVIEELDWSAGEILKTLRELGLDEKTLVVFTSDNGPWLIKGADGGQAAPLRDGKWSVYEGGMRVPCVMRWPGKIPAGAVCREVATTMDFLPTLAKLAGADAPKDRVIDGKDIAPLMLGEASAKSPHEAFFYSGVAVRSGKWKLHAARNDDIQNVRDKKGAYRRVTVRTAVQLYDLEADIGETKNVAAQHPDIVRRLSKLLEEHNQEIAAHARPVGTV